LRVHTTNDNAGLQANLKPLG